MFYYQILPEQRDNYPIFMGHPHYWFASPVDSKTVDYIPISSRGVHVSSSHITQVSSSSISHYIKYLNMSAPTLVNVHGINVGNVYTNSLTIPLAHELFLTPTATDTTAITTSTNTYNFLPYLRTQLKARYALIDPQPRITDNYIVDSSFPYILYHNSRNLHRYLSSRTILRPYAISEFVGATLNCPVVPTEDLCTMLGYTVDDIKKILSTVADKHLRLVFLGAGGTGTNTIYWLNRLLALSGVTDLFDRVDIADAEQFEFSNLLRFPFNPMTIDTSNDINKASVLARYCNRAIARNIGNQYEYLPKIRANDKTTKISFDGLSYFGDNWYDVTSDRINKAVVGARTVFYGAPNLETRHIMSSVGNFICATHADNSCSIWLNPSQDLDIQVESYGTIQLAPFFLNQLKMTISFLELLASDQDLQEKDKHILEYSFQPSDTDKYYINYQTSTTMD